MDLKEKIIKAFENFESFEKKEIYALFLDFRQGLEKGEYRAAALGPTGWKVNSWVKMGILLGFKVGQVHKIPMGEGWSFFFDKDTYPLKKVTQGDKIRVVPGGTGIRSGSFVAQDVVIMPPSYINVGAYVDKGSMIDSHALVGSCAQIGKKVHLSAAAQVGGVLEPIGSRPVIIEDEAFIGGNCGIYEGTLIGKGAVLGSGVILTRSTRVYDMVQEKVLESESGYVEIPAGAVVVPGVRKMKGPFAEKHGIGISTPLIIKYRDEKTGERVSVENLLRV